MANILYSSNIEQLRSMIDSGNLSGFYTYMASQGYQYGDLDLQFVTKEKSGAVAINFMEVSASRQGLTLSEEAIGQIKLRMAHGWLNEI